MTSTSLAAVLAVIDEAELREYDDPLVDFANPPNKEDIPEVDRKLSRLPRNDFGNATRLATRFGEDLFFVDENGWYAWTGTHWSHLDGDAISVKAAHKTVRSIRGEVLASLVEGPFEEEKKDDFEKRIRSFRSFAQKSGDMPRIRGMLESAQPYMRRPVRDLDAKPFLFNVLNGTLDLEAGKGQPDAPLIELREHRRSDMITKCSEIEYDPAADAPQFREFLAEILPNPRIRIFVQQWFGYSLTGLTTEQKIVMLTGQGSNGKSVLMNAISHVLGEYAMVLPFQSLLKDDRKRGADASPDLARLPGARYVSSAEPEQGAQFSESMLKSLTGGENMTVRQLRKEFFEFRPQFKLVLSFNNRPQIRGQDHGIWRRILLVPFEQKYVEEHELEANLGAKLKDKELEARLKAEAPGILNWLLEGYALWAEKGLLIPDEVLLATAEYRHESNPVGQFLIDWTEPSGADKITASSLYEAYKVWCGINAQTVWALKTFGTRIGELSIQREKVGGFMYYTGIKLKTEAEQQMQQVHSERSKRTGGAPDND